MSPLSIIQHVFASIILSSSIAVISAATNQDLQGTKKIGIIFDCDGVLVDTEHLKFLSWQKALEQNNILFEQEDYIPLVGHSGKHILKQISEQKNVSFETIDINGQKSAYYRQFQSAGVPPLVAAVRFVQELAAKKNELNIMLGLASSAGREEIMVNLEQIGLADSFDVIVSGHDDLGEFYDPEGTNKPKPYIYQKTAKLLGLSPSQCVVFEDTNAGVTAAVGAGMIAIAVPNSYTKQHDFSQATCVLDSFDTIRIDDIIAKVFSPLT